MIGKNRRVVASILSLAVMASALPMTGVFAVEDTASTAVTATKENDLFYKNLTIDDLLYIKETEKVSTWNESFARHIASLEERGYNEAIDMSEYQDLFDIVIKHAGGYSELIQNIIDNADVNVKLENSVFTVNGRVNDLSQIVGEKIDEKVKEAAGEYADEINMEIATQLNLEVVATLDTTTLAADKTVKLTYKAYEDGKEYSLYDMIAYAESKLNAIADEYEAFCNDKVAEAEGTADYEDAVKAADSVKDCFDGYKNKLAKVKEKADNYLNYDITAEAATADEAYNKLYNKVQGSSRVPEDIKAEMPATLAAAVASEEFATALSKISNVITPADVQKLLDGASSVKVSVKDGIATMTADVYDAELDIEANKTIKVVVDASNAKDASEATVFVNITRKELKEDVTTTVTDDTTSTDESNSDVTTTVTDDSSSTETSVSDTASSDDSSSTETSVSDTASSDDSSSTETSVSDTASSDDSSSTETSVSSDTSSTETSVTTVTSTTDTSDTSDITVTPPVDDDSLWNKALNDTTGKFRAGILGDMSLDFDIKAEELMAPTEAINSFDALTALQCVVSTKTAGIVDSVVGDVNFDGQITSQDALLILQYTVRLRDAFEDASANKAIYVAVELDDALENVVKREYYTIAKVVSPIDYKPFGFDVQ